LQYIDCQFIMMFDAKRGVSPHENAVWSLLNHHAICVKLSRVLTQTAVCFASNYNVSPKDMNNKVFEIKLW